MQIPNIFVNPKNGTLSGADIIESKKILSELVCVFEDKDAFEQMPADTVVYRVQMHNNVQEGVCGGLFFGTSFVSPGIVGDEYFMTKGHFHEKREAAEYYWCVEGSGILLTMQENGKCEAFEMKPGSLHYIQGNLAHRIVNTGDSVLAVGACWPSDAGHDYGAVESGFSVRVKKIDGKPVILGNVSE
jgi:Thermophilic glucose-6-phosphate isomerase and related metalloenzymes